MKILLKLISLGVDVNVHDVAGYTPLHHCLTLVGNETTLKMAEKIVRAGVVSGYELEVTMGGTLYLDLNLLRFLRYVQIRMIASLVS